MYQEELHNEVYQLWLLSGSSQLNQPLDYDEGEASNALQTCLLWEDGQDKNRNLKKINSKTEKKPKNIIKNIWKETTYAEISFY